LRAVFTEEGCIRTLKLNSEEVEYMWCKGH
jgi:hypothetical protein